MNELGNTPADKNYQPSGISKAVKRALEVYPDNDEFGLAIVCREAYVNGYRQATKDTEKEWLEDREGCFRDGVQEGKALAEKDLGWHSVKESLPPMDEEVIVLSDIINGKEVHGACCISFGHIVDKRYCVDYDGWNIPGIHHWMPCPKINGKELGLITKEDL